MKYRTLGKTGLKVSVVGLGAWQFGGEWGKQFSTKDADAIIKVAGDNGINLIDTAECYGDHLSEELVGHAVEGNREKWIIATKFGHKFHSHMNRTRHWSPDEIEQQLHESLKALHTDYIDIYQFHSALNEEFEQPALWERLWKFVESGKVRHIGMSINPANEYQAQSSPKARAEMLQILYNRLDRIAEEKTFPWAQKFNLGVLARVPLASGYLSGKYKPGDTFASNDVRSGHDIKAVEDKLRLVQQIKNEEVPQGVDMASWALAWCLKHPAVTTVIPGCKSPEQVRSNAAAAAFATDDHPQAINE
ncbi:MAG: aldo/keto reductase [Chitinivibrionales bacterium]|nr:aldo/keto reductase [Chitinivibrionales bacterium]